MSGLMNIVAKRQQMLACSSPRHRHPSLQASSSPSPTVNPVLLFILSNQSPPLRRYDARVAPISRWWWDAARLRSSGTAMRSCWQNIVSTPLWRLLHLHWTELSCHRTTTSTTMPTASKTSETSCNAYRSCVKWRSNQTGKRPSVVTVIWAVSLEYRILHPLHFYGIDEDRIVKFCARVGPRSISLVMTNRPQVGVVS